MLPHRRPAQPSATLCLSVPLRCPPTHPTSQPCPTPQIGSSVLQVKVGSRPRIMSWEEAADEGGLRGAKMPVLTGCSAAALCAGTSARVALRGRHLRQPCGKAFARLGGHDVTVTVLPPPSGRSTGAAPGGEEEVQEVELQLPAGRVGLLVVEQGVGHLLGGWWQLAVLPDHAAADEVNELLLARGPPAAPAPARAPAQQQQHGAAAAANEEWQVAMRR